MKLRLLREVAVRDATGDWVSAGPAKRAAVLAILTLARASVTQDQLVDRVWGDSPPGAVRSALYSHVARLRRLLSPLDVDIVRSGVTGYRLEIERAAVDVFAMRDLVAEASAADRTDDTRVTSLRRAWQLWQGTPLADVHGDWADRTRTGLERERISLAEQRFDAELDHGAHAEIVDELRTIALAHPESERLAGQLMTALYRCGRQSEALDWYVDLSSRLREESGLEPAPSLRTLHTRILRHDPALRPPTRTAAAPRRRPGHVPRQLPPIPGGIVDRDGITAELTELADTDTVPIGLITGMAGVGKTTTALRWAHAHAADFADGQLFADLAGFSGTEPRTPAEILAGFLMALGMPGRDVPADPVARVDAFRSRTADRRLLVLLDNAATAEQVRPLIPTGPGSRVLITSRNGLSGLVAVEGARRVGLGPLDADTAARVLVRQLGTRRAEAEPEAVAELVEVCGRLPLALRIAAANLADRPQRRVAELVAELSEGERLDGLAVPDDATAAVGVAFSYSLHRLDAFARTVFAAFGTVPGPSATAPVLAAMLGATTTRVTAALRGLAAAHLVHPVASDRFGQHDLLKEYARRLAPVAERDARLERLFDWYVHTARHAAETVSATSVQLPAPEPDAADRPEFADPAAAMTWIESELDNLMAVVEAAGHRDRSAAWLLPEAMRLYFVRRMELPRWLLAATTGMRAARAVGDDSAIAAMHYQLALHAKNAGDADASLDQLHRSLSVAEAAGDRLHAANAHASLADSHHLHGRLELAIEHSRRVLALEPLPHRLVMNALNALGGASREIGDLDQSRQALRRNETLLRGGNHQKLVPTLDMLALTHMDAGDFASALAASGEATRLAEGIGAFARATTLTTSATIHLAMGETATARDVALSALEQVAEPAMALYRSPILALLALCDTEDPARCLDYANEAVERAENLDLPWTHTLAHIAIATVRLRTGRLDAARAAAQAARERADRHRFAMLRGVSLRILAEIAAADGDRAGAVSRLQQALPLHQEAGHRARSAEVRARLTDLGG